MSETVTSNGMQKLKELATELKTANIVRVAQIRDEMVTIIANELKPEATEYVELFENDKIKTTKGNYGKYMQLLSQFKGVYFSAMVKALKDAGAGQGLNDAFRIIKGEY